MDSLHNYFQTFLENLKATSLLEYIAVIFSVLQVVFARLNKVWLYPCGIISSALTIYLFAFQYGLFADAALFLYYVIISIYGWIVWSKKNLENNNAEEIPTYTKKNEWLICAYIITLGGVFCYFILKNYTSSTVPIMDTLVSVIAWAGTFLLTRRKVENWIVLNISNLIAIPLYFHKGSVLYGLLTIMLFIIAVSGYYKWKRLADSNK